MPFCVKDTNTPGGSGSEIDVCFRHILARDIERVEDNDGNAGSLRVEAGRDPFGCGCQNARKLIGGDEVVVPGELIGLRSCGAGGGVVEVAGEGGGAGGGEALL